MRSNAAVKSIPSSEIYMTLTDELRNKAQLLSASSNAMHDTLSSLAGMLGFIERILADEHDMSREFCESLIQAVKGCRMLATAWPREDGFETIMFLRDIASGRLAASDE